MKHLERCSNVLDKPERIFTGNLRDPSQYRKLVMRCFRQRVVILRDDF